MAALPMMNSRICNKHNLSPGGPSVRSVAQCSLPRSALSTCKPCRPFKARSHACISCASAFRKSHQSVAVTSSLLERLPEHNDADCSTTTTTSSRTAGALMARSALVLEAGLPLWLLSSLPALAADDFAAGSASTGSYYATLFLFVATLPGLWSLVKRAPKASKKRKVFEVPGPKSDKEVMPLDARARQVFGYFKKYNYEVRERGEVITFVGNYAASRGQAAALVFYVFFGLASAALVLSIAAPFGGSWWYAITLISPAAGAYYLRKGDREEEFKVKMVTSDDELTTDIVTSGDVEETTRFCMELNLTEKGKEYVKGILER